MCKKTEDEKMIGGGEGGGLQKGKRIADKFYYHQMKQFFANRRFNLRCKEMETNLSSPGK